MKGRAYARPFLLEKTMKDSDLIGMTKEAAMAKVKGSGRKVRVISEDGVALSASCDYVPTRVNIAVVDGLVTAVSNG